MLAMKDIHPSEGIPRSEESTAIPREKRFQITFSPFSPEEDDDSPTNIPVDPHWNIKDKVTKQEVSLPANLMADLIRQAMCWAAEGAIHD